MSAASVDRDKITSADELFDMARTIANSSGDPVATYEGFLRGLEMGLTYASLSPVMSKAIGNKLADLRPREPVHTGADPIEQRPIVDPRKPAIRKAPPRLPVAETDFPTEWTLDPS